MFNSPNKVELKYEERRTPYQLLDEGFKPTMKMWKADKNEFKRGGKATYGLVAVSYGFTDSPDAEFISGGESTKPSDAPAIARHGNFMMWGFSAAPSDMTEQAQKVFLNSIEYIYKFKGQKPLALSPSKAIWNHVHANKNIKMDYKAMQDSYKDSPMFSTLDKFMAVFEPELYPKFKLDLPKYKEYYKKYFKYMRANPDKWNEFIVDMDAYKFGTSFMDKDFLPKCIEALKDNSKKDIALKLLKHYTNETFENAKQWAKWYKKNKTRIFFTEMGGFKYLVDIYN